MEQTIKLVKPDAVVSIEIGEGFYRRCQELASEVVENKTPEELESIYKSFKEQKVEGFEAKVLETMLILIKEFGKNLDEKYLEEISAEEYMKRMSQ